MSWLAFHKQLKGLKVIVAIGIDIVDIEYIKKAIQVTGKRFMNRVFTNFEIVHCENKANKYQNYADRFAVKEAVMKALGTGWSREINWKQIEIRNNKFGVPKLFLTGSAEEMCNKMGVCNTLISISHCKKYAIAKVLFEAQNN